MQQIDSEEKWPETDLEYLGKCPACDSARRTKLFDDIRDHAFHVAPGTWSLWRCGGCEAAYLDPRPTESSIGRAYESYCTHAKPRSAVSVSRRNLAGRVKLGYYNSTFGYNFEAGLSVGKVVKFSRTIASLADFGIRHLPAPKYEGAVLLDIGCGNGSFLLTARDLGYAAVGLEPDEDAVRQARAVGLDVRMGMVPNSVCR